MQEEGFGFRKGNKIKWKTSECTCDPKIPSNSSWFEAKQVILDHFQQLLNLFDFAVGIN